MLSLRLRRRRERLARALEADAFARAGWQTWLDAAGSIRELHRSCPEPAWLVYCAYFDELPQDQLLAGALAVARVASAGDPDPLVSPTQIDGWAELSFPELGARVAGLERGYPTARALLALLQAPFCFALVDLERMRIELQPDPAAGPVELGPFRADPDAVARETLDGLVAAGYAAAMLCLPLRHEGLREAVTVHAAAAASLLRGSYAGYRDDALAALRRAYAWA